MAMQHLLILMILEVRTVLGLSVCSHMLFQLVLCVQRRLTLAGVRPKESLDKDEAIDRIIAAGNSSRLVSPCPQFHFIQVPWCMPYATAM